MGDGILQCPVMKNAGNKKAANEIGGLTVTERLQIGKGKA